MTWLWKYKNKIRPLCVFILYMDYDDISIMEFHDHEPYLECLFSWVLILCWYLSSVILRQTWSALHLLSPTQYTGLDLPNKKHVIHWYFLTSTRPLAILSNKCLEVKWFQDIARNGRLCDCLSGSVVFQWQPSCLGNSAVIRQQYGPASTHLICVYFVCQENNCHKIKLWGCQWVFCLF